MLTVCGKKRRFLPVIASFIQDTLEGNALCGVSLGVKVNSPCRCCTCTKDGINDPTVNCAYRTEARTRQVVEQLLDNIEYRVKGISAYLSAYCTA